MSQTQQFLYDGIDYMKVITAVEKGDLPQVIHFINDKDPTTLRLPQVNSRISSLPDSSTEEICYILLYSMIIR